MLGVGVREGDVVEVREGVRELVGDGDGDGDGLQPTTTGWVRLMTRCWVPTVSTTVPVATFTTAPHMATGVGGFGDRPEHWVCTQLVSRHMM
jgi:hypothetical protein